MTPENTELNDGEQVVDDSGQQSPMHVKVEKDEYVCKSQIVIVHTI